MKKIQINTNSVIIFILALGVVATILKINSLEGKVSEDVQSQIEESVERELSAILDVYEIYIVE